MAEKSDSATASRAAAAKATANRAAPKKAAANGSAEHHGITHREAVKRVREARAFVVNLPVVGKFEVPPPEQLAYYGGLAALVAFEILEWPVALAVAAGHLLASQHHNKMLEEIGEVIETIED